MQEPKWKEQFPETFQELWAKYSSGEVKGSMTYYAFKKGALKSRDYLRWARDFYHIAILQDHFFAKHLKTEIFERTKEEYQWSAECVPVAEWDGAVFVALLDPEQLPTSEEYNFRPLLASYEMLVQCWLKLNGGESTYYVGEKVQNTATGIGESAEQTMKKSPTLDSDKTEHMEQKITSLELRDEPEASPAEGSDEVREESTSAEMPEGIFVGEFTKTNPTKSQTLSKLDFSALSKSNVEIPKTEPKTSKQEDEIPEITQRIERSRISASPEASKNGPNKVSSGIQKDAREMPKNMLSAIQDNAHTLSGIAPRPINKSWAAHPLDLIKSDSHLESLTTDLFTKSYKHFSKAMILKIDKDAVVPVAWDQTFKPIASNQKWQLNNPSIFRIAFKSQRPFHGSVSINSINKNFFDLWFGGKVPLHVSIFPIILNDEVRGLFLASSNTEVDKKESLKYLGKISNHLRDEVKSRFQDARVA